MPNLWGAPGGQNCDLHLTFPGPRLQRCYQVPLCDVTTGRYVTITKPCSTSLHFGKYMCSAQSENLHTRDCAAHSQNPEIEQAISRLCNTCAQSGDCVTCVQSQDRMICMRNLQTLLMNLHTLEIVLHILRIPRLSRQSQDCVTRVHNLEITTRVCNLKIA